MKILSPLQSFLSQGRVYKASSFIPKPSLRSKFASFKNGSDISNISFTNPDRQCSATKLGLETKFPLHITLPATNHDNQGRIYTGDYPSVTTILDATRPKSNLFALLNWRRKQITDLGKTGYEEKVANLKNRGTSFHEAVKQYLSTGVEPELLECNKGHWKSVAHVLSNIDQVIALESVVVHPDLHYAGTLDGVVSYQGKLCVIDWKTSEKKRTMLKDCFSYPHQIVAYAGAVNHDQKYAPIQVCCGLLVLAYNDGSPADAIWMSLDTCQSYWNEWLIRVELYNQLDKASYSSVKSLQQKQGNKLKELAQFVDGVPVKNKPPSEEVIAESESASEILQTEVQELEYGSMCITETSEWFESAVDIFETDPSVVEFDDSYESQTDNVDCITRE